MKPWALIVSCLIATAAPASKTPTPFPSNAAESFCNYLEWVLNSPLTLKQRSEAAEHVKRIAGSKDALEAEIVQDAIVALEDLSNHSEDEKLAFRESVEDELFKILKSRFRHKPLALWVLDLNQKTHKIVAEGPPALTQQALEAWEELFTFISAESMGAPPDPVTLERLRKDIPAEFSSLEEEQKRILADAASAWAALRYSWNAKKPEEKQAVKEEWKTLLQAASKDAGSANRRNQTQSLIAGLPGWL